VFDLKLIYNKKNKDGIFMNQIKKYGLKLGGIYLEKGIEKDEENTYVIILNSDKYWIYTLDLIFDDSKIISNTLIQNVIKRKLNEKKCLWIKNQIPTVLHFMVDGYLGQIEEKLLKALQKNI